MRTARTLEAKWRQLLRGSVSMGAKKGESSTGRVWNAGFHHVTARNRFVSIFKLFFFPRRGEPRILNQWYGGTPTRIFLYTMWKIKPSYYRAGQALRISVGWDSQISRQSAHEGSKVVSPTQRPPLPPGNIPGTHFCFPLQHWLHERASIIRYTHIACLLKLRTSKWVTRNCICLRGWGGGGVSVFIFWLSHAS
jgi:hypothetical protein